MISLTNLLTCVFFFVMRVFTGTDRTGWTERRRRKSFIIKKLLILIIYTLLLFYLAPGHVVTSHRLGTNYVISRVPYIYYTSMYTAGHSIYLRQRLTVYFYHTLYDFFNFFFSRISLNVIPNQYAGHVIVVENRDN